MIFLFCRLPKLKTAIITIYKNVYINKVINTLYISILYINNLYYILYYINIIYKTICMFYLT